MDDEDRARGPAFVSSMTGSADARGRPVATSRGAGPRCPVAGRLRVADILGHVGLRELVADVLAAGVPQQQRRDGGSRQTVGDVAGGDPHEHGVDESEDGHDHGEDERPRPHRPQGPADGQVDDADDQGQQAGPEDAAAIVDDVAEDGDAEELQAEQQPHDGDGDGERSEHEHSEWTTLHVCITSVLLDREPRAAPEGTSLSARCAVAYRSAGSPSSASPASTRKRRSTGWHPPLRGGPVSRRW